MEESEKRKERLKAMRMEASQVGAYTDFETPGLASGGALSNPLIESEPANASPHRYTSPRFDYYTDPISAFSGSKRRNNMSQVSQGHYNTPPSNLRLMDQGMITNPMYYYPAVNSPCQGISHAPRAHFNQSPIGSPIGAASPLNRLQQNPPSAWGGGSGGAYNYGTPPNLSRGGNFTSPGWRKGDSPYVNYGQGRGHQEQNSSSHYHPGCGRGSGRSFGNSTSPGFRRGRSSRGSVSADQRPDLYYSIEMVQDPWLALNPVIWKGVNFDKSWLPKSIAMKKYKVSSEAPQISISQQSLAEYLAASFNDSIDEAAND